MGLKKLRANKKATRGKVQAWKKGQSSSFNPKCTKFRQEAKKRALFAWQANPQLTEGAVARHNLTSCESESQASDVDTCDATSIGKKSFATTFSNCTNPTFERVLSQWQSNSVLHKERLAVIAAISDVIRSNGGNETDTEYFAALVSTLDIVDTDEGRTAVITLLYLIIKKLPDNVLKVNFPKVASILKDLLTQYCDSEYNALLRNLLGCLYYLLKVLTPTEWTETAKDCYTVLLGFTVHQKPKVRREACQAVRSLLSSLACENVSGHVAPTITAKFCINQLESYTGAMHSSTVFHVLNLLQSIMCYFTRTYQKLCCETILRVMTLSNAMVVSSCLNAFQGLFNSNREVNNLPADLNIQIIQALYDYQPAVNDSKQISNWLIVMEAAFINLYRNDPSLCISHLPKFFKIGVTCWTSDRDESYQTVASCLKAVLGTCIDTQSSIFQQLMQTDPLDNPMHKMFHYVEGALSYQYHSAWKYVLDVLAGFFDVMGKHSYPEMLKCLKSLADLRDSHKFQYVVELDKAFGCAIHRMGPEVVLKAVPLLIDGESDKLDFPRSWLLPLLRDNVKEAELGFFIRYFLPLASKLRKRVLELEKGGQTAQAKIYEVICSQIWSLLPGFCNSPKDLKQSFPNVAQVLGVILMDQPSLRSTVLSSLRILISKNLDKEENKLILSRFAKNYLPRLFNLYTTESSDKSEEFSRLAVFETIKVYLQIAQKDLCIELFLTVLKKLEDSVDFTQQALIDLNKAMIPYVNEEHIKMFYDYCKQNLQNSNHTVQKKCYGALREICAGTSEGCNHFVENNMDDLKTLLLTSLSSSSPPSKALRLSCLQHIVKKLADDQKDFIIAIVPEATLCTKETATRARKAAFSLLSELGHTLKRWNPKNPKDALREYMQLLLAGFAGSPHLISATILAIGHVLYEFKDLFDSQTMNILVENICLLLSSKSREVVTSALSFVKILLRIMNKMDLAQHVELLVKNIAGITEDNQRHFRFKAKELFTRLIRKFGYEMISSLAPEQFQKQLTHIRKMEARKIRRRNEGFMDEVDSDEEMPKQKNEDTIDDLLGNTDDELDLTDLVPDRPKLKAKRRKAKDSAWIVESTEDNIVDFTDPRVNRNILGVKPQKETTTKEVKSDFEIAEDGRLIIRDEESVSKSRKRKTLIEEQSLKSPPKRQKKRSEEVSDNDDPDNDGLHAVESKPVLKGIHRQLNKKVKGTKTPPGAEFKAKKAAGDIRKGKVEPYAYIPLNRQFLNKRKQKKLKGQFAGIVRAAKKGAQKGSKRNPKNRRNKNKNK